MGVYSVLLVGLTAQEPSVLPVGSRGQRRETSQLSPIEGLQDKRPVCRDSHRYATRTMSSKAI